MKYLFFLFFVLLSVLAISSGIGSGISEVIIYQNGACGHCSVYLAQFKALLEERGIPYIEKDMIKDKVALQELDAFSTARNIPYELQGHMAIIFNDLVLEGHVPLPAIEELFNKYPDYNFPKQVLYQDSMDDLVTDYRMMDESGVIKDCNLAQGIDGCTEQKSQKTIWKTSLPLIVLSGGLFAGIHPCTISVLLFFIAFLFTLRRSRVGIFKVGLAYIIGIFLAYLGIGFGIFKAVTFSGSPHFAAKIGASLVVILGLINIISFFSKKKGISLGLPKGVKPAVANLIHKATVPAAFIVGIIVGICSFGCTAGIYLSIMSLLFVQSRYLQGLTYLILYNIMFILPLIVILLLASNKHIVERIEKLEQSEKEYVKIVAGITMIVLGIIILWITYMR